MSLINRKYINTENNMNKYVDSSLYYETNV